MGGGAVASWREPARADGLRTWRNDCTARLGWRDRRKDAEVVRMAR